MNDHDLSDANPSSRETTLPQGRKGRLPKGRAGRSDRRARTRASGDVTVALTERDVALLRLVDEHRLLNTEQLLSVAGQGSNSRAFLHRLAQLFHAGVLDRPRAQFRPGEPSRPFIYAVGAGGRSKLDELDGRSGGRRSIRAENDRLKLNFIDHEIAVAEATLAFRLACQRQQWACSLALGDDVIEASGLPPRVEIRFRDGVDEPLPLCADAHIRIDAGGGAQRTYLLEVDLGTEPNMRWNLRTSSILRKVIAYWQIYFWPNAAIDGVIFLTTSHARIANMIDVVRQVDRKGLGSHFFQFGLLSDCRISKHEALFYEPYFWSSKVGYDNPRLFLLPDCPTCHALIDIHNERYRYQNEQQLVHETCPRDLSSAALS